MKMHILKILKSFLYVFVVFAVIVIMSAIISHMQRRIASFSLGEFAFMAMFLQELLLPLVVSITFSYRHLKELFKKPMKGHVKMQVANLVIVAIAIIGLYFSTLFQHIFGFLYRTVDINLGSVTPHFRQFVVFAMLYNLIYAFERK